MSLSLARLGLLARAEGRAALKEWPKMCEADGPITGRRRLFRQELRMLEVRREPEQNMKTGSLGCGFLSLYNFFRAATGQ